MKVLKNCIKLNSCVKIYVPSTKNIDEKIDSQKQVNETLTFLSNCFGGSTATRALGAWVTGRGDLIKEDVTMVFSYAIQSELERCIELIYDHCIYIKKSLAQESVALEVNGELYLI